VAPGGFKNPLLTALKVDGIPAVYVVRADGRVQPIRHVAHVDDVGAELLGIPNAWALNAERPSKAECAERYGDADKIERPAAPEHWTYSGLNPRTNQHVRTEVLFDRDGRLTNAAMSHVCATPAKIKVTVSRGTLERVLKNSAGRLGEDDASPAIELGVEATDRWGLPTVSLRRLKADATGQSYSCDFELAGTQVARLVLRRQEKELDFVQLGVSLSFEDREVLDVDLDEKLNPTPQR
jgi:hypothetical protein